jgi:Fe-S-cluster containining protein
VQKSLEQLPSLAGNEAAENKAFFTKLSKKQIKQLDNEVHAIHDEVFDEIDCLDCANCCKSLGPRITDRDIERMGKALKMKSAAVVDQYLRIDEDGDFVFREMPCPFLAYDNYCLIYDNRPKACREYPHTDRKKFYQIRNLTLKNVATCPAVYEVMKRLRK